MVSVVTKQGVLLTQHAKLTPRARTLFLIEKLMKLVSTNTWYGGPSCVLYLKNRADDTFSLHAAKSKRVCTQSLVSCLGSRFQPVPQLASSQSCHGQKIYAYPLLYLHVFNLLFLFGVRLLLLGGGPAKEGAAADGTRCEPTPSMDNPQISTRARPSNSKRK